MKRIVIAALFALTASAQQSEVINVQVNNLDVVVTDSKGKRVSGLTQADFEVLENGKPQAITNLSEFNRKTATSADTTAPAPRRILLIVDNGSIALSARRKVFNATRAALEKMLIGPSDRLAIATVSRSLQQRLPWTADKAQVLSVLTAIEKDAILPQQDLLAFERLLEATSDDADKAATTMGAPRDRDGNEIRDISAGGPSAPAGGGMMSNRVSPPVDFQQIIAAGRNYAGSATTQNKQTLSALSAAITSFSEVPGGRKLVILVGGGLPLNAAEPVFQRIETARERAELSGHRGFKGQSTSSTLTQISGYDITPVVDQLADAAKMKGVAFYAVNPEFGDRQASRVTSRGGSDQMAEFAAMKGMLDGYNRLASATGGTAMIGRPADQVLTEIVNDLDSYYSLGYRASGPLNPKSQIEVKVRKGLTARTTISSGAVSRDWEVSDQVLANLVAEPANPLNISVVMDPPLVNGEKKTIPLKIMIPVDSLKLMQDGSEYAAAFTVFISLGDPGGNGSAPIRQEQSFRWPEAQVAQVKGKTIGFTVSVEVVGGNRDRISVGVLDQYSGNAGFTRVMLE